MTSRPLLVCFACALSLMAAGCFKVSKVPGLHDSDDPDAGEGPDDPEANRGGRSGRGGSGARSEPTVRDAGTGKVTPESAASCIRGGYCGEVESRLIQTADVLFVVDNSGSMRQEQNALREQFPLLIAALTTGRTSSGEVFPPLRDIHLGVVSTDMGLAGIANNFPGCNTQRHINGGDDGLLQHPGMTGPGCSATYPQFLSYLDRRDSAASIATEFGCIAALGTSGCGFEQPLEAALKALWPKNYVDADGNQYPPEKNPILFLSTTNEGRYGHGDVPTTQGGNGDFMRREGALLAIVVVTDEEDCSSRNTNHFVSTNDPADPLSKQGINLRCFYNKQNLFEIDRYVKGFQALHPGREQDVLFAAIVGVPAELVSAEARAGVNWAVPTERDAYYDRVLGDMRMQERPMNEQVQAIANVAPSCTRTDAWGERADAYPPRRIVEVAKGIGENAMVQSICQDDFGPAMNGIIDLAKTRTQQPCLPAALRRAANGKVDCDVLWELPPDEGARCTTLPFLSDVAAPRRKRNDSGGRVCMVTQLAAKNGLIPEGEGFYYDDFSAERQQQCRTGASGRIAFSGGAQPPPGVHVFVDCAKASE